MHGVSKRKLDPVAREFYSGEDVVGIAKALLGKVLYTCFEGHETSGIIVETEAYRAPDDRASHAFNNRRTPRTEVMFGPPGMAYVYVCYGIHHLFNIITGPVDLPHAILIRAVEPREGIETMLRRRRMQSVRRSLTAGPGILSQALAIRIEHNGLPIYDPSSPVQVKDPNQQIPVSSIVASARVGVESSGESAKLPWRFRIADNPWTSPAK